MIKRLLIFLLSFIVAQELDETLTLEKKSVIILPGQDSDDPESISRIVTGIVSAKAVELGRFNVIDRTQIESILSEQKLQLSGIVNENQIVDIGNLAAADEGILVRVITFGQRGVPPKKKKKKKDEGKDEEKNEETLFEWVIKEGVKAAIENNKKVKNPYPNNIQTILEIEVRLLNIETGISQNSFLITGTHTGGNKTASMDRVLNDIKSQISLKLRGFYLIASEVIERDGSKITILSGDDMGLEEGTIFEISSPDQEKTYKGRVVRIPGKIQALAKLTNIGTNSSSAEIIRQWENNVQVGHIVNEMVYDPTSTEYGIKTNGNHFNLDAKLWWSPFNRFPTAVTGHLGTFQDSREENDFFIGLGVEIKAKLFTLGKIQYSTGLNLPFNMVFKTDDDGNSVSQTIFNPAINFTTSIILGSKRDIFIRIQYVSSAPADNWEYSESVDDEEGTSKLIYHPAVWHGEGGTPILDIAGLYLSVGMSIFDY